MSRVTIPLIPKSLTEVKNDVLVIEDSIATSILIRDFLRKLGYTKIQTCNTGKAGIQAFSDLVSSRNTPIVMLDFHLPDMNAKEVMEEIYNISPDVRIIIETADSKMDEQIKETLRGGAYQYLEKPIRFENLKNIFDTLEMEKNILKNDTYSDFEKIISFLKSIKRISLIRLHEYSNIPVDVLKDHLHKLENEKKIIKIEKIREISCNQCNSVRIAHNFLCMSCHSSNFKQEKLIEHFKCSNVSTERSYKEGKCPKCKREIKTLGVDYKSWDNYYTCNDCGDKFPNLFQDYTCLNCNNQFALEKAKWTTSDGYKVTGQ